MPTANHQRPGAGRAWWGANWRGVKPWEMGDLKVRVTSRSLVEVVLMLAGTGFRSVCCVCEERAQVVCMYTTLQRRECGCKCAAQQIHHCALLCCAVQPHTRCAVLYSDWQAEIKHQTKQACLTTKIDELYITKLLESCALPRHHHHHPSNQTTYKKEVAALVRPSAFVLSSAARRSEGCKATSLPTMEPE